MHWSKTETTADMVKEEPCTTASDELMAHWASSVRVTVPGLGGMVLAFYNESIYLYNNTDCTLTMKQGMVVANFHKGKWVRGDNKVEDDNCVPFCFKDSDDLAMVGQQVCALGKLMEDARLKDPLKTKLAYHDMVEKSVPGELYAFTATCKYQHAWKSEPGDVQPSEGGALVNKSCAGWVPHRKWEHMTMALTWIMKWSQKGPTPVRPVVVLKCDLIFKPGEYIQL